MDDFGAPSLFDYATSAHSSMSATLDTSTSSGVESTVKQETLDSISWIHGLADSSGCDFNQSTTFQSSKPNFLQDPTGFESLISGPLLDSTPSVSAPSLDPLEYILNQPQSGVASPFSLMPQAMINSRKTERPSDLAPFSMGLDITVNSRVKCELPSDLAIINALNGIPSTHNAPQGQMTSNVVLSQNASQGQAGASSVGDIANKTSGTFDFKEEGNATASIQSTEVDQKNDPVIAQEIDPAKDLNLSISNVVTSFRVRCHLNLRRIAQEGINVIYQKEFKKIVMKVRNPSSTAYIWSSGKVICTGANSESNAKKASRKFAKRLQKLGFQVIFSNYKVINVLAVCKMPFHLDIVRFSEYHRSKYLSYEPEIHPAVTFRMPEFKVTFKIFSTGSVTLTCPVVARIPEAIKKLYPMVSGFFKKDQPNDLASLRKPPLVLDSGDANDKM